MNKTAIVSILLMCILPFTLLAGGSKESEEQQQNLTFAYVVPSPSVDEMYRAILDEFEQQNDGIQVEYQGVPWDQSHQKLITQISAGNPTDVQAASATWVPELGAMDGLVDLEPYFTDWEFSDDYTDYSKEIMRMYQDRMYHIPFGYNVRTMFYRKDVFEERGLEVPDTFEEFLAVCQELTDPENDTYCYSLRGARGAFFPMPIFGLGALGTNQFFDEEGNWNLAKPEAVEGLEFLADLYREHQVAPPESINWGFNELIQGFLSGRTMIYLNDQPTLNTVLDRMDPEQIGTAKVPAGPSGNRYTTVGGMGWIMPRQEGESDAHRDARIALMRHMASPETLLDIAEGDLKIPPIEGALERRPNLWGDRTQWLEPTLSMVENDEVYSIPLGHPYPENAQFIEEMSWQDWQRVLGGEATMQEIANKWAEFHEQALRDYQASLE